jgi:hypothetical protein
MHGPLNVKYFDTSFFITPYSLGKINQKYIATLLIPGMVQCLTQFTSKKETESTFSVFELQV